jgi:GT2 family glycosyltransferase
MTDTDVAIAIVTYKSADLTIDCLRSIETERASTKLNVIAIVVDNAS